ncbi:hypothetical protein Dimus_027832 [Dionaea muscipula]
MTWAHKHPPSRISFACNCTFALLICSPLPCFSHPLRLFLSKSPSITEPGGGGGGAVAAVTIAIGSEERLHFREQSSIAGRKFPSENSESSFAQADFHPGIR